MTLLAFVFLTLFVKQQSASKAQASVVSRQNGTTMSSEPLLSDPSLKQVLRQLRVELPSELIDRVVLTLDGRGLVISIVASDFFSSGSCDPSLDAVRSMRIIARIVRKLPNAIRLEGYADSQPIHTKRFRSNWELSSARSLAVFHLLEDNGVSSGRISIASYADTKASKVKQGFDKDRRVDIVVLSS